MRQIYIAALCDALKAGQIKLAEVIIECYKLSQSEIEEAKIKASK